MRYIEVEKIKKIIKSDYYLKRSTIVDEFGGECEDTNIDIDKLSNDIYEKYAKILVDENNLLKELLVKTQILIDENNSLKELLGKTKSKDKK